MHRSNKAVHFIVMEVCSFKPDSFTDAITLLILFRVESKSIFTPNYRSNPRQRPPKKPAKDHPIIITATTCIFIL